jgi:ferritin-like metal-binding protein YciE
VKTTDFETMYVAGLQEAEALALTVADGLMDLYPQADDPELRETLRAHAIEAGQNAIKLKSLLDCHGRLLDVELDGAVDGLFALARHAMTTTERSPLRDMALVSLVQRVEHHEIAIYGTLAAYAKVLGRQADKLALGAILEEDRATDEDLTAIASRLAQPFPLAAVERTLGVTAA